MHAMCKTKDNMLGWSLHPIQLFSFTICLTQIHSMHCLHCTKLDWGVNFQSNFFVLSSVKLKCIHCTDRVNFQSNFFVVAKLFSLNFSCCTFPPSSFTNSTTGLSGFIHTIQQCCFLKS